MQVVPDSANIQFFDNSTFAGDTVSYSNGTTGFFAAGVCPQPVSTALYDAVISVEQDQKFVSAENGSTYTINSIESLAGPLTAPNGSEYEALVFDNLNTSDTIFPCNLSGMYKNPLGQIEVLAPILANGSLDWASKAIFSYSGKELQFNCPSETGVTTFAISQIPEQFQVGGFSFQLLFNGTNYRADNGTSYQGFEYVFSVSYDNPSQLVLFHWVSFSAELSNQLPSPFVATPFDSYVVMRWFTANSTLYLRITTSA
jgi:hypothetical protein